MKFHFDPGAPLKSNEFQLVVTSDGSPTLQLLHGEAMHSRFGALSETLYIYGEAGITAIEKSRTARPSFLSIGLGVAYVEIVLFCLLEKFKLNPSVIWSYEKSSYLRKQFQEWADGNSSELSPVYNFILHEVALHYDVDPSKVRAAVKSALGDGTLVLQGALNSELFQIVDCPKFNGIFFDAFSSKTNVELWNEIFLNRFLNVVSATPCLFTTYAATGALKRSLVANGYTLLERRGFGTKRESTLAFKSKGAPETESNSQ